MTKLPAQFACLSALLFTVAAVAQQNPPAARGNSVTLYVVANDKSGNPVTGLQRDDFTVLDNKQPQRILSFAAVGQTSPSDNDTEIVLLLDEVNTDFTKVAFAKQSEDNFLKREGGRLSRPVSIAILSDSGLEIQPTPSEDGNAEAAFLDQHQNGLRTVNRSQGFYGAAERIQMSVNGLLQVAQFEAKRPGRKLVIWISPGWAYLSGPRMELTNKQEQGIVDESVQISAALQQARVTLYMVDPLGTSESIQRRFDYEEYLKPLTKPSQAQFGNLALQVLVVHSGGRVVTSSNDVTAEIERCARDANAYYVLRFDPSPADGPKLYHAIEVKIKDDLKAQTLSGFYEQPGR